MNALARLLLALGLVAGTVIGCTPVGDVVTGLVLTNRDGVGYVLSVTSGDTTGWYAVPPGVRARTYIGGPHQFQAVLWSAGCEQRAVLAFDDLMESVIEGGTFVNPQRVTTEAPGRVFEKADPCP